MQAMTEAAVALFSEEGYSAVSTRRIAERAGCSETLLFRYFGDKRGLLMTICNGLEDARPANAANESGEVRDFIEGYLLDTLTNMKHQAPTLKIVIAALVNDPEMTVDFEKKHDEAVEYVADRLRWFQDAGAIGMHVDVVSLASAIEQLSFAVGFLLQLVFERPQSELVAIAKSSATVLSEGLQAGVPQPHLEPVRRKAVAAAVEAREQLESIIGLLENAEFTTSGRGGGLSRQTRRPPAKARRKP